MDPGLEVVQAEVEDPTTSMITADLVTIITAVGTSEARVVATMTHSAANLRDPQDLTATGNLDPIFSILIEKTCQIDVCLHFVQYIVILQFHEILEIFKISLLF